MENKIGLTYCKVIEEMNRLGLKNQLKEKVIGVRIGYIIHSSIANTLKTKSNQSKVLTVETFS